MLSHFNDLNVLAKKTKEGDSQAKWELRNQLEPGMFLIVRRILQHGDTKTNLARRVHMEYRQVVAGSPMESDFADSHIKAVTHKICDLLVSRLEQQADSQPLTIRETVMDC